MLDSFFIPLLVVALLNSTLGLLVLLRNHKNPTNLAFFYLALFVGLWAGGLAGFIAVESDTIALIWAKIYYIAALGIAVALYYFDDTLLPRAADKRKKRLTFKSAYSLICLIYATLLLVRPSFLTSNVSQGGELGREVILNKPLYAIYSALFLIGFIQAVRLIFIAYRKASNKVTAEQNRYLLIAVVLATTFGVYFNLFLPWLGNYDLIWVGPQFSIIFVAGTALSIVKHRLFNIQLVVVRSLGYVISVGILVLAFALISSFISQQLSQNGQSEFLAIAFNAVIFAFAVVSYPYLKRYFDRLTSKLFFRDAYDAQEFLDELNKSIVSNIEIGILLRHTTKIIEENLKSTFVQVVIPKTEATPQRITGTKEIKYSDHELNYMRGRLVGLGQKVIAVDELSPEEDELQKIMNKHDISVLVHLSARSFGQEQTIAYMIFGNKKSGNIYSKSDLKIIEIIADELVIAIQNALRFEEIQDFNVTLQDKVSTATNKLRRTNEKLKAMDETKDEFISMASHQLRTPLTSVKGYLSMVLEGDAGEINETQRKLLDQAFVSSQRMVYLIADLLNVSRLRTGKFVIDTGTANLAKMVEEEISQLKEQANLKNIALSFDKPDKFPDMVLDETKTRQVIMNFIDNALYYTPANGKIEVAVREDKHHVYFMVKDNGIGVPKEEQKHLFTKFYRAKNARNLRPDGTGLGLFMAKKVITAQGGSILFESKENKGSTFGFSFSKKYLAEAVKE